MNGKKVWTITVKLNIPKYFNEYESCMSMDRLLECNYHFNCYYGYHVYYKLDFDSDNTITDCYTKYEYDNHNYNYLYHITLLELLNLLNIDTKLCDSVYLELCSLSNTIDNIIDNLMRLYPDPFTFSDLELLNQIKSKITKLKYSIKKDKNINSSNTRTCTLTIKLGHFNKSYEETIRTIKRVLDYVLYELNYTGWTNIYFNIEFNENNNKDYEGYKDCEDIYAIFSSSLDKLTHLDNNYINKLKDINNTIDLLHNKLKDEYGWIYRLII